MRAVLQRSSTSPLKVAEIDHGDDVVVVATTSTTMLVLYPRHTTILWIEYIQHGIYYYPGKVITVVMSG